MPSIHIHRSNVSPPLHAIQYRNFVHATILAQGTIPCINVSCLLALLRTRNPLQKKNRSCQHCDIRRVFCVAYLDCNHLLPSHALRLHPSSVSSFKWQPTTSLHCSCRARSASSDAVCSTISPRERHVPLPDQICQNPNILGYRRSEARPHRKRQSMGTEARDLSQAYIRRRAMNFSLGQTIRQHSYPSAITSALFVSRTFHHRKLPLSVVSTSCISAWLARSCDRAFPFCRSSIS